MAVHEIDHLSASQINLYIQCSLKYRFLYVDRMPKSFKPSGLAFGSVLHSSLDWLHKQRKLKRQVSLDDVYRILKADWFCQKCENEIRFKDGEDENALILTAREMLSLYYHSPLNGTVESEFHFRLPLINPATGENLGVPLDGYIDLIESGDILTEFKTSARTMDADSLDDMLQLTMYSYAYRMLFSREPRSLKVINFVKTRTPKMKILDGALKQQDDYAKLFQLAKVVFKGIRTGIFFPRKSFLCGDCEYEKTCRGWTGNGEIISTEPVTKDHVCHAYA